MKKFGVTLLVAVALAIGFSSPAFAVPGFKKAFDDRYPELKGVSEEQKCNLCHYGKSKKNKNDYGVALSELLKKENFKEDRVKAEPDKVKEEYDAAFKKVEEVKSKSGETFGERLKAKKAPGTPEAGA
ncbi:MAG: hypothetical protein U0939_18145 [Pirellulales bacterium]